MVWGESWGVAREWRAAVARVALRLDDGPIRASPDGAPVGAGDVASWTDRDLVAADMLVGAGDEDTATGRRIAGAVGADVCDVDGFTSACGAGSGDG